MFPRAIPAALLLTFVGLLPASLLAQLVADPARVDFGRQRQDQQLNLDVDIRNTGDTSLELVSTDTDCRCTAASLDKKSLAPGEHATLRVSLYTRTYIGKIDRVVVVRTNAGDLTIPVSVDVAQFDRWTVTPYPLIMRPSQRGKDAFIDIALRHSGGTTEITKVETGLPWLLAQTTSSDGEQFQIKLLKRADAPAGNYTAKITVASKDPAEPSIAFEVFVPINSPMRVSPSPVILPTVKVGQASLREITLQGYAGSEPPRLEVADGTVRLIDQDVDTFKFEVSLTPKKPGPTTQLLRVYDGDRLELEVPVMYRAEPAEKQ